MRESWVPTSDTPPSVDGVAYSGVPIEAEQQALDEAINAAIDRGEATLYVIKDGEVTEVIPVRVKRA